MSLKSNDIKYGKLAIIFHWLSALLIIGMIPLGKYMHGLEGGEAKALMYKIHVAFGLSLLLITIGRVIWRFRDDAPRPVEGSSQMVILASKIGHLALYLTLFAIIFSGMAYNMQSGLMPMLLSGEINWPNPADYFPIEVHDIAANLMILLIVLHVVAALWHQLYLKDNLMARIK